MDDESRGLLDADPALDCILVEEMEKEERPPGRKGCLTMLVLPFLPVCLVTADFIFSRFR
jgi:hypothetical protein